jgi:glycerol uptake facilitator-like aquaporin
MTPSRRFAAEGLGTGLLVATVIGSGIMAERLAGGNVAVALLANAISTGAMLYVLITTLGPVSGAHFNPVVTLATAMLRETPPLEAAAFVAIQMAGAVAGTVLAHAMFELPLVQESLKLRSGPGQWLAEAVATAGLILTIRGTRRQAGQAAACVALYITAAYWFTASTSFANPAVTLARALSDSFAGIAPVSVPGFLAAQMAGGAAGLALAGWLFAEDEALRPN